MQKRSSKRKKLLGIREVVKKLPSSLWKALIPGTARETCSCAHTWRTLKHILTESNLEPKRNQDSARWERHRQLKLCGSSLDFEFIRECMKINKIRLEFQFWTKIEIKIIPIIYCPTSSLVSGRVSLNYNSFDLICWWSALKHGTRKALRGRVHRSNQGIWHGRPSNNVMQAIRDRPFWNSSSLVPFLLNW